MNSVRIKARDPSGNWRTYLTVMGAGRVLGEMHSLQSRYPDYRIRAVDSDGRIIDIL